MFLENVITSTACIITETDVLVEIVDKSPQKQTKKSSLLMDFYFVFVVSEKDESSWSHNLLSFFIAHRV